MCGEGLLDGNNDAECRGAAGRGNSDDVKQSPEYRYGSEQHYSAGRHDERTGDSVHEPAKIVYGRYHLSDHCKRHEGRHADREALMMTIG